MGAYPAAKAGLERFWDVSWWLLAAPGGSWASPRALLGLSGPLLAPPGQLLSLGTLRGSFWELFELRLKALKENRENLDF